MKIKNTKTNKEMNLVKCKKPRFSIHRGRTWDIFRIRINGVGKICNLDTTWGMYAYLNHKGQWYKGRLFDFEDTRDSDVFSYINREYVETGGNFTPNGVVE